MEDYENQGFYNQTESIPKPKKKIWLWILIPVLIIVIGFVAFYFISSSSVKISDNEFSQGTNIQLEETKEAKFIIDNEEHTIKVNSVSGDSVNLIIQSDPIQINLKIGEEKKFDLNNDGFYDLQVKLNGIEDGIPEIYVKKIRESVSTVEDSHTINSDDITLDIILPKNSYEVDEEVSGDYYLKYQGEPFKGAIVYCDHSGCSKTTGMLDDIDFNNPDKTNALKVALTDTFYSADTYDYSIYIYDCQDIDDEFNTDDCGKGGWPPTIDIEDIVSSVTPLKSKSKTITVTGVNEEYTPECTNNDDCTQTCTHCDDGTYVCAYSSNPLINQKCVECITDFSCVDGYACENNVCVEEEEEPEPEPETYPVTDPDTIMDCYSEDLSEILCSPEKALEFTETFETRLGSCEISEGTFALGFEPFMGIFRGYEIQDEQNGNCVVKFWFLENSVIDSSLINKDMICEYDSSKRTAQGVNDCFEECCSGELVDALNAIIFY